MFTKSKKIQATVLVILILLTTLVSCAATQNRQVQPMPQPKKTADSIYTDIRSSWAYEAISYVLDRGLFQGTSETTFSPDQPMTRSAFESALAVLSGKTSSVESEASEKTTSLTREDMAVLLYEFLEATGLQEASAPADGGAAENAASGNSTAAPFTDESKISSDALVSVNAATSLGLMSGKNDGSFTPAGTTTRAEASTVIYRLCKLINETNTSDDFLAQLSEKTKSIEQYADYKTGDYKTISLKGSSISFSGTGAAVEGNTVTITKPGTYVISGSLEDGRIVVDSGDDENVRLVLNNAQISSSDGPPLVVKNAKNTIVSLPAGTENTLADSTGNTYDKEASGALFSADDLWINGTGVLKIYAKYKDGISGNDDIKITQAEIVIDAADDGISANDSVILSNADVTVKAARDGVKATRGDKIHKGFIAVNGGSLDVTSGTDGLQAETLLYVQGGSLTVDTTGSGDGDASASTKGLKAGCGIVIEDGSFSIDSIDDAIHSNGMIRVDGGTFKIVTGDDALHADFSLAISGGTIAVSKCYEGIESRSIELSGGSISLTASDDGINAAGGTDNFIGGRPGGTNTSVGCKLTISGGDIKINAGGDGIDVNGSALMTGGTVLINGPTDNGNSAVDYDGVFEISGGILLAAGSSGMAMAPSSGSTQYTIANTTGEQAAGTSIRLVDGSGKTAAEFTPSKAYSHVVISSHVIKKGAAYTLYAGNTEIETFTISDVISGNTSNGGGTPGGGPQGGEMPGGGQMPVGGERPGEAKNGTGGPGSGNFPGGAPGTTQPDRSDQQ